MNDGNSYLIGLKAKGLILYLKRVGTLTGDSTVGVWSGANTGGTKTVVGTHGTITTAEANAIGTTTHEAVTRYFTERTLVQYDSISLQANTVSGVPSASHHLSWEYIDTGSVWDSTKTSRNRFTSSAWSPTTGSDMRAAIITNSDALVSHEGIGGTISYPSLPNGTIFEELDTGKHMMFDGSQTWNEMV